MMTSHEDSSADREDLLEQLFHSALQQPVPERRAWLVAACDGDDDLVEELLGLVECHAEAPSCFEQPVWAPGHRQAADDDELSPGSVIGPYVVGRLLGEGGMGSVYLAEQCEPLRRQVALKVIKPGMDTREVLARFNAERRLLARLSHPHVASVHDAGVTPRGRPYFVMELVDGEPITRYCDQRRLGVAERLALFETVCDAVQHAHQKGVVHRDLKPGNIMVSDSAGRPLPKIIDFGVAKAISGESGLNSDQATACTRLGQQIGTPGYMSPEQALPDRGTVDTRTDVYSLGVLLHELLVGALPRDAQRLERLGPEGLARELAETDIEAPSQRLAGLGAAGQRHAARRGTDLRGLVRNLRGDLDWIVLKAVATHPDHRYASASELAADVNNSLAGLPVTAGPPNFFYRARRLATAHRTTVASACVLLLALLAWPTMVAYLRGQELERQGFGGSPLSLMGDTHEAVAENCAVCLSEMSAVHDTVLVTNSGSVALAVGDLVELVGETRLGDALVLTVAPARVGSGRAPLGPLATALTVLHPQESHCHAVSGAMTPGGFGRVVVRGTLALLAVDDSGGSIRANQPLVVGRSLAHAAAEGPADSVIVGTALQDWFGPGEGLIRAHISPRWAAAPPEAAVDLLAAGDRSPVDQGGGGWGTDLPASQISDGETPIGESTPQIAAGEKLLPSTTPASLASGELLGEAAAIRLDPDVSGLLTDVTLLTDRVETNVLSGQGGPSTGGLNGTGAGTIGQDMPHKSVGLNPEDDLSAMAAGNEQVWGDLNGDGLADVIITARGQTTVLANLGQGLFEERTHWAGLPHELVARQMTLSDVDGDGFLDLLALDADGRLGLYQGQGDGRLLESTVAAGFADVPPLFDLAVIDPEQDGAPDLQLWTRAGELLFLLNDGRATFTVSVLRRGPAELQVAPPPGTAATPGGSGPDGLQVGDEGAGDETLGTGSGLGGSQPTTPGGTR